MRARSAALGALVAALLLAPVARSAEPPLAEGRIEITGSVLAVEPAYQAVPRNTATAVNARLVRAAGGPGVLPALPADALVTGTLRGPALATPLELSALPNQPIAIPPLSLSGVYTLEGIRLVAAGRTLFEGAPGTVQLEVIDRVLVSQLSARPLGADEIREKGIVVDEQNFQVLNFSANFGFADRQVRIDFPMLVPNASGPGAPPAVPPISLPALSPAQIPETRIPGLEVAFQTPNVAVSGLLLRVEDSELDVRGLDIPPLPAVVVIPGNVAYLNQFFSVLLMASNAAPGGSQLELRDVEAEIRLPAGRDTLLATVDDPLRMARLGTPPAEQAKLQPVVSAGADGERGTPDDRDVLGPGEDGDAEFLVEGVREGGHTVEIEIRAMLHGLPVGPVRVSGRALGLVEVRNPSFALTLSHPATITAGEEYDLLVTVTNTSDTPANFVSLNLLPNSISGARLLSAETQEIESIGPGEAAAVSFRLRAQVTGDVVASSLTSDPGLTGRFELHTAVGALGIPLSPNSLVLPRSADSLPASLREAAVGFLGQAFALATSPVTPRGLAPIGREIVLARARDIAEAGQRVALGEPLASVARDLLFRFAGSDLGRLEEDHPDPADRARAEADLNGLDALLRRSERGRALVDALGAILVGDLAAGGAVSFQIALAEAATALPPPLSALVTARAGPAPSLRVVDPDEHALGPAAPGLAPVRAIPFGVDVALGYEAALALLAAPESGPHRVELTASDATRFDLAALVAGPSGLRELRFENVALAAGGRAQLVLSPGDAAVPVLAVDADGDGHFESERAPNEDAAVADGGPRLLAAAQILTGSPEDTSRFGTLVGLLFSEAVSDASAQSGLSAAALTAYAVEENQVVGAQRQPGGRVVLIALREGIGPYFARTVVVTGIEDLRGNALAPAPGVAPIAIAVGGGGSFAGSVRRGDGTVPYAQLRLSLTEAGVPETVLAVKDARADGSYAFDFVPDGIARLEAFDRESGESGEVRTSLRLPHANLDVVLLGTGTLVGRTLAADAATPLAGAVVVVTSLTRIGEQHGTTSAADGSFVIPGIPVGNFSVEAVHASSQARVVQSLTLASAGATQVADLVLLAVDAPSFPIGALRGQVFRSDGRTPAPDVPVYTDRGGFATTDATGSWRIEGMPAGPVTVRAIDQAALEEATVATTVVAGAEVTANLILLGGTATVVGTLFDADGRTPIANALIGGGLALVRSGSDGSFVLPDVPIGSRTISALDEASGRTAQALVVLASPGEEVAVRLQLEARATLAGTVFDAQGDPVADLEIFALGARNTGTTTDADGAFRFEGLPLGGYLLSAFLADFSDGNLVTTQLAFPNEVRRADVVFRGRGRVRGLLLNESGNPLGGGVIGLSEIKPKLGLLRPPENTNCLGDVTVGDITVELPRCSSVAIGFERIQLARTTTSDVTAGTFAFADVFVGAFDLEAGDRFSGDTVRTSGEIPADGATADVVLQFPPNAREIAGTVYQPDGITPVAAGVAVCLPACAAAGAIEVRTDDAGRYLMQFPFVSGDVLLEALDDAPIPPRRGQSRAAVDRGASADVPIRLLGTGRVEVAVRGANGPIAAAEVELRRGTFPGDVHTGIADADGRLVFEGGDAVTEGPFSVSALARASGARGFASAALDRPGATASVEVVLPDASGLVQGRFLRPDGATPIPNAQVRLSSARGDVFATSDAEGRYGFAGVPIGTLSLEAFDPVTAARGHAAAALFANGQQLALDVVALGQGSVLGTVVLSREQQPVAGADVTLTVNSIFGQMLRATTQADGSFRFPGVSEGDFSVTARDALGRAGSAQGRINGDGDSVAVELVIEVLAVGRIEGLVREADGSAPAAAEVALDIARHTTTDATGFYFFDAVPLGSHSLRASQAGSPDAAQASVTLGADGEVVRADLAFVGTGSVHGSVRDGAGAPVGFARVSLSAISDAGTFLSDVRTADAAGRFAFASVAVGQVSVTARDEPTGLAGSASGRIDSDEQELVLDVALEPSAALGGRVVREDGVTPAAGMALEVIAGSLHRFGASAADGTFLFEDLSIHPVELRVTDPLGNGIATALVPDLAANETRDFGDLVLDESAPEVVSIDPADGESGVPVAGAIEVLFSEPIDTASVSAATLRVTTAAGPVAGALAFADAGRRARFTPAAPFRDFERVSVRVTEAVRDLAGRPLAAETLATFTTADSTPPAITSRSPAPAAIGVALDAVLRIGFSERVEPAGFAGAAIELRHQGAVVAGRVDFAFGDSVAIFTPAATLLPDSHYEVEVGAARDAFGNAQASADRFAFDTVDTRAPVVCTLSAPGGPSVRVGATARIVADLGCEPDAAAVEFFVDGALRATDSAAPFELLLPIAGSPGAAIALAVRARDAAGNLGPFAQLLLDVEEDAPPSVELTAPAEGSEVASGASVNVQGIARDDTGVAQVVFQASGAAAASRSLALVPPRTESPVTFSFAVPADAAPGAEIIVRGQAIDTLGQSSAEARRTLRVRDASAPAIEILSPAAGAAADAGSPLSVRVRAVDPSGVAEISVGVSGAAVASLVQAITPAASPAEATFGVDVPAGATPAETLRIVASARDAAGNAGSAVALLVPIRDAAPPLVSVHTASGASDFEAGAVVELVVSASDAGLVREIGFEATGLEPDSVAVAPPASPVERHFVVTIPADAELGAVFEVAGRAVDRSGNEGFAAPIALRVADLTPPGVEITAPASGTAVVAGTQVAIEVVGSDDSGITRFELAASGALSDAQSVDLAGMPGTATAHFDLAIPSDVVADDTITVTVRAFDAAGLSALAQITLVTPDLRGPRLVEVLPPDGTSQSTSPAISARFDEPIARASATAARFFLQDGGSTVVPTQIGFADGDRVVTLTPQAALATNGNFRVVLLGGITDAAGNAIANADGSLLVRVEHAFTIGGAVLEAPVSGARVIEGQSIEARAVADAGLGERAVSFLANGDTAIVLPADPAAQGPHVYETNLTVPTLATLGGSELRVGAALALPSNLATQAGVTAAASSSFDARFSASRVADGNLDTSWFSQRPAQPGEFVDVALAQPATVGRVEIFGNRESADGFDIATGTVTFFDAQGGLLFRSDTIALPAPVRDAAIDVGAVDGVARVRFTALSGDAGEWGLAEIVVRPVLRTNVATLEVFAAGGDEDGDGISNGAELVFGTDPFADDRTLDDDSDGLSNAQEFTLGTNPRNRDSDGDGLSDGAEVAAGLDPLDVDSDDDGVPDGEDVLGGPRLLSIEPAAGGINVSVRPRIRLRFDEPLAPASVTAASFALFEGGTTPVAATFVFSEGERVVDLVPSAPLAFSAGYTLAITNAIAGTDAEPIRNSDGTDLTASIERSFTTGVFGVTEPAGGASVRELSTLSLAASGDASLGVASVRFEVNGAVVSTDAAAPFTASFAVPAANVASTLSITAIALDAGSVELARDAVAVDVVVGLDVASGVLGVPLGGTRDLVLRLPVARAAALDVTVVSLDAAVASVPAAPQTIPAGATELRVPVTGVAEGATTLVASTLEDQVVIVASVSALAAGTTLDTGAAPVGFAVQPFSSAGDVIVPESSTRTVTLRILSAPAATDTELVIVSSDPAVASIAGPVVIPAGSTDATFEITTGAAGTALVTLVAGDDGRELRVISGAPNQENMPPAVAPPVGLVIVPFSSAGDVIVPQSSTRTVTLRILSAPAAADTELVIVSSDPAVASIAGPVVIPAGSTDATFEITTGAAGTALVTLVAGDDGRELRVIAGAPNQENTPPAVAPPVGLVILPLSSAGDVIVPESSTRTVTLRILSAPAAADTELVIVSSDPAVASIAGPVVIPAGSTDATFEITTGAAGTALVTLVAGIDGRELRVISGAPNQENTPPAVASPVGLVILPFSSSGDVIVPESSTRTVTLRILAAPAAADTELVIVSSDLAVASIAGPVVIPAGSTDATFEITTGAAGTALVTLVAGDDGRELRVISGAPSAANTPPVVGQPVGIVVMEAGSAATLFIDPGATKTFDLTLLAFPSLGDLPVEAVSLDASIATVSPGAQVIPTGESTVTLTVTATAAGDAETRIDLVFGVERRTLRVMVGVPAAKDVPTTIAPPICINVLGDPPGWHCEEPP